eukprot:5868364-Pleurochrysis_carterae.AAC.1
MPAREVRRAIPSQGDPGSPSCETRCRVQVHLRGVAPPLCPRWCVVVDPLRIDILAWSCRLRPRLAWSWFARFP